MQKQYEKPELPGVYQLVNGEVSLSKMKKVAVEDIEDFTVYIPKADPHFATSLAVIFLQLLGYYVSVNKSRNLAKSVTVEQEQ